MQKEFIVCLKRNKITNPLKCEQFLPSHTHISLRYIITSFCCTWGGESEVRFEVLMLASLENRYQCFK
jgi:hypothetical protein